ncbi:AsmA family protein [Cohaesibacter intestini]|uniref:AsmA family protein n=1 Tax=Cohaesibacter intestini TaxID=2211145 RepID=UPI000DEABEC0|nr:AsmA family protein [Cohaesibacter intestini]
MRNILISLLSTVFLVILALAMVPVFVSTDFLKSQVQQFVQQQSGMKLDISGDVSLSLLTGLRLSADKVALRDQNDQPLVAIGQLDFSLALSPLLSGKADITGITLIDPVLTLTQKTSSPPSETDPTSDATSSSGDEIDLSALSLRQLGLRNAMIVRMDGGGHQTTLLSGLDLTLRAPDFDGAASLEGSLPFKEQDIAFSGEIANVRNAVNGRSSGLTIAVTNDLLKAKLIGELALKGDALLVANYAFNAGNVTQLFEWLGAANTPLSIGKIEADGSLVALANEIRLPALNLAFDDQAIHGAARIFTDESLTRPLIRVALDMPTFNVDALLADKDNSGAASNAQASQDETDQAEPDLSALREFDLTADLRAGRITYQGKSLRQLKLLAQIIDGQMRLDLKSANLAKGNLQANLSGDLGQLLWNGSLKVQQIDIQEAARLAGQASPLSGMISSDLNFAAKGLTPDAIANNGNLAGQITLANGKLANPALQAAIPGRESGTIDKLTSRVTITSLDQPIDIAGAFGWNGETIRYSSRIGLAEALRQQPIPASLSVDARPLSLALSGLVNPASVSLSGSTLSIKSPSSRNLLSWLGQSVTSGTPDLPISLSTKLALSSDRTNLQNLSLHMGQSRGSGNLAYQAGAKPVVNGALAFETLDLTPFMGDGKSQGRTARASTQTAQQGWDTSPIDFSGLNNVNAELTLSAKSLVARDIKTGSVQMAVRLKDGQLSGSLDRLNLYEGQGTGGFFVNAATKPAQLSANFALANMQMSGFLRDSIDMKALSGRGGVTLDLTAKGASQADIIRQLNGFAKLEMLDGQIRGINIPQMMRRLSGNILEGWSTSQSQTTDFSSLTASFQFNNGMVSNQDLLMLSPLFRLAGTGQIDLPNSRIDYKATPKLSTTLKGQGGLVDAQGVPIPIIIKGKLTKPRIYPDIPGILENPDAIFKGLQQLGAPGKAASEGLQRVEKNITKEIQKQSDKLGIDLNKILKPQSGNNNQPQQNQNQNQQQQQQPVEQRLLRDLTKGLFGN